jgi:hypothetical protein
MDEVGHRSRKQLNSTGAPHLLLLQSEEESNLPLSFQPAMPPIVRMRSTSLRCRSGSSSDAGERSVDRPTSLRKIDHSSSVELIETGVAVDTAAGAGGSPNVSPSPSPTHRAANVAKPTRTPSDSASASSGNVYKVASSSAGAAAVIGGANDIRAVEPMDQEIASSLIFHAEYYLTDVRAKEDLAKGNIFPDQQSHLRIGRPNLPKIFAETAAMCRHEGISRVAVFTCGPPAMVNEVADLSRASRLGGCCAGSSGSDVKFDCHSEVFDF